MIPVFSRHHTGPHHPERPERLRQVVRQLERTGLIGEFARPVWQPIDTPRLALVHAPDYVARVAQFASTGGGLIESDTVMSAASYDVARLAAGAAVDAVQRVVQGEDAQAICLVRPPGHHALARDAMGFCLFNNIALAARVATDELGLDRVLIVDWDVHHGNGTQDAFWTDPRVGFLSIHRWPFYPGTGDFDETGSGPGPGHHLEFARGLRHSADRIRVAFPLRGRNVCRSGSATIGAN